MSAFSAITAIPGERLVISAPCGANPTLRMENKEFNRGPSPHRRSAVTPFLKDGIAIEYEDAGTGKNVLVLVHGHPFNRSMWRPQIDAIAGSDWRVIAPDLRGYGASSVVPGKTTLEIFARDIAELLDGLGIGPLVIGGLSMGGQIVMEFCRRYPERVRGVLLAATFPKAETEEGKRNRLTMADRLLREGMDRYAEEVLPKMLAPVSIAALPEVAERVRGMMRGTDPSGAAAALRGRAERPDYESALAKLDVPALVIVGDQDAFTTRADAERMHELLKGSELIWMTGVGHMPNLERPGEFNAAAIRWLGRVMA
jgi:3-oxoadipate enol-lactonase